MCVNRENWDLGRIAYSCQCQCWIKIQSDLVRFWRMLCLKNYWNNINEKFIKYRGVLKYFKWQQCQIINIKSTNNKYYIKRNVIIGQYIKKYNYHRWYYNARKIICEREDTKYWIQKEIL